MDLDILRLIYFLILKRRAFALFSLVDRSLTWYCQLRFASIFTPRCSPSNFFCSVLKITISGFFMNCLAYWYWYGPQFYNWLPVFLEKAQTTGTNKNFIICCRYFSSCYLFVSLCHFSHYVFALPITRCRLFNIFLFFIVWALRVVVVSWIQKTQEEWFTS